MGYFGGGVRFDNCFGVLSCSWTTFISFVSFNSDIWFGSISGSFLIFWGPNGLFLGLWKGSKTVLGSTHVVEQLSFSVLPSILTFDFDLILVFFLLFGALIGYFVVEVGIKNCFEVSLYSWTTFIFLVSSNSDIWFWLNFGAIFEFLGP